MSSPEEMYAMSVRASRAVHPRAAWWQPALVLLALIMVGGPLRGEVKAGDRLPPLAVAGMVNLAGGDLPVLAGQVVLVDFWASWCAPCKASFPALARLHRAYASRGLVIVAVGIDEKPPAAVAFWKKMAPPFATLHDREQRFVQAVGVPTMPTSYLLGRDGAVRFVHEGFHGDATERALQQQVESLLSERLPP